MSEFSIIICGGGLFAAAVWVIRWEAKRQARELAAAIEYLGRDGTEVEPAPGMECAGGEEAEKS